VLDHDRVTVQTRGGELVITWAGEGQPVFMTGPAVSVFEGEISLPDFEEATTDA
jgi:diaminopimelate epimerase